MKRALVVGINNYPRSPLAGCINDAHEVANILRKNEDGSVNYDVYCETDVKTKGALKEMIESLFSGNAEDVLFYFSGHGTIDALGGYIVTPDFSAHDMGISMEEILNYANQSGCHNKIIILDCCHAGHLGQTASTGGNNAIIGQGVTVLTSCERHESAVEIDGHGIFTTLLISALSGGAADLMGEVTPGSIYAYIDRALGSWDQRPMFKTNIHQFSSIRRVKPQIPLEILHQITKFFSWEGDKFSLDPSFEDTNSPEIQHEIIPPYADPEHVQMFKALQKMQSVGLVKPIDAKYMYFAAMESKSCALTPLGQRYWQLVKNNRL